MNTSKLTYLGYNTPTPGSRFDCVQVSEIARTLLRDAGNFVTDADVGYFVQLRGEAPESVIVVEIATVEDSATAPRAEIAPRRLGLRSYEDLPFVGEVPVR